MLQNYTNLTAKKYDKNIYLSLKQKRLRHVHIVSANNLKIPSKQNANKKFQVWYTLHETSTASKKVFYVSDKRDNDYSPKWSKINHSKIQHEYLTAKEFIVRIWYSNIEIEEQQHQQQSQIGLLIEMNVSLDGLSQLNEDYLNDTLKTADNLIVFDMFNRHYSELVNQTQNQINQIEFILLTNSLKMSQTNKIKFKPSYPLSVLMRLNDYENVIYNSLKKITRLKAIIRAKFNETSRLNELKIKKELFLQRLQMLRSECERKRMNILVLGEKRRSLDENNGLLKKSIAQKQASVEVKIRKSNEIEAKNEQLLSELIGLKENLIIKQKKLIGSLSKIYPIEAVTKLPNGSDINLDDQLKIANIYLPSSKFYFTQDEQKTSVALGYVCHCLLLFCYILNIPLRYPIIYRASKSSIINYTPDKSFLNLINSSNSQTNGTSSSSNGNSNAANGGNLVSNENYFVQELALYSTNSTQEATFSHAVFLLNKNLAQLRILFDNYKNIDFNNTLGSLFWLLNQT